MSTRGVIGVSRDGRTWFGRYHQFDSYPEGLGLALQECYRHFGGDIERMLHYLLEEHRSGWRTIVQADFNLPAGFVADYRIDTRQPQCYCHGDRKEPEWLILDTDDTDAEWAYIFDLANKKLRIFYKEEKGHNWIEGASFAFSELPLTEQQLIEAGDACEAALEEATGIKREGLDLGTLRLPRPSWWS